MIILFSLFATIIFGLIDGLFFLLAENTFQKWIIKFNFFNEITAELFTGGFSASVAIFVSTYISILFRKHFNILEHPFIDSFGILLGTIIIILFYKLWEYFSKKYIKQ